MTKQAKQQRRLVFQMRLSKADNEALTRTARLFHVTKADLVRGWLRGISLLSGASK